MVASLDGKEMIRHHLKGKPDEAESLGTQLAESILSRGGGQILKAIYEKGKTEVIGHR
jgi:hydroxymethylbilane synthase